MGMGNWAKGQFAWLVAALSMASCGSNESATTNATGVTATDASQGQTVMFGAYIGTSPGDAQGLQALIEINKRRHPQDLINYEPINPQSVFDDLAGFTAAGTEPDTFTHHAFQLPMLLAIKGADFLYPLNDFFASPTEADALSKVYPELLADATIDGKILGLPAGIANWNSIMYNRRVFETYHVKPPTTLDEFRTACQTLKAGNVTPFGVQPSWLILLNDLMPAVLGLDAYVAFMKGGTADEATVRKVVDVFAEMVDYGQLLPGDPTGALMNGQVAMLLGPDYWQGTVQQLGWTPSVDYSVFFAPGNAGLFTYTMELLSVRNGTPNLQGALNWVDTTASLEGQTTFHGFMNSTPTRKDVDLSVFSAEKRVVIEGMKSATHRLSLQMAVGWDGAITALAQSTPHDKEPLVQAMLSAH